MVDPTPTTADPSKAAQQAALQALQQQRSNPASNTLANLGLNNGLQTAQQASLGTQQADIFTSSQFDSVTNDLGFFYQSEQGAATNPIYNNMLSTGSVTKQMHGAYGRLGNVYKERTELQKLQVVRSEVETWMSTLPEDQKEAIKNGRFTFPQSFIRKMQDMGYSEEQVLTAMDGRMSLENIQKLLLLTYRSEQHMKNILQNLADSLAWWVKDNDESVKKFGQA